MKQIDPDIEMQIYRNNIKELQGQLQEAYKRTADLQETIHKLMEYVPNENLQTTRQKN